MLPAQAHAIVQHVVASPGNGGGVGGSSVAALERVIVGLQQQLDASRAQLCRGEEERAALADELRRRGALSVSATKVCAFALPLVISWWGKS